MKRNILLSSLFAVSILLNGCSSSEQKNQNTSENANQKQEIKSKIEDSFNEVFEDINNIVKNKDNKQELMLVKLNVKIDSWTVENLASIYNNLSYAAYDINKDGVDELLIASDNEDNKYLFLAYYLENDTPQSLGESYVASAGGGRSSIVIYEDGSILSQVWSSGTGDGVAKQYKIAKEGNGLVMVNSKNYTKLNFKLEDFGLSLANELKLDSLEWKKIEV